MTDRKVPTDETLASLAKDETISAIGKTVADGLAGVQKAFTDKFNSIKLGKQDKLSDAQQAAVDSGITEERVKTYDGYRSDISKVAADGDATDVSLSDVSYRVATLESVAFESDTIAAVRASLAAGTASADYPVGSQIVVPWKHGGKTYGFVWDVAHHFDGSDSAHPLKEIGPDMVKKKAICLQAHYALPDAVQYNKPYPAYTTPSERAAGAYTFVVNVEGSRYDAVNYQFTTTKSHPAGAKLVIAARAQSSGSKPSPYSATWYDNGSDSDIHDGKVEASETVTITRGSTGTSLGTIGGSSGESTSGWARATRGLFGYAQFNSNSNIYKVLDEALAGFSDEFRSMLGNVSVPTARPSDNDSNSSAGSIERVTSYLYPPSAVEHYFSKDSRVSSAIYNNEGVALDLWKNLANSKNRGYMFSTGSSYATKDGALLTYDIAERKTPRKTWTRSADGLAISSAMYSGRVSMYTDNYYVSAEYACEDGYVAPLACIVLPD